MIVARACRVLLALIAGALAVALLVACAGTHGSRDVQGSRRHRRGRPARPRRCEGDRIASEWRRRCRTMPRLRRCSGSTSRRRAYSRCGSKSPTEVTGHSCSCRPVSTQNTFRRAKPRFSFKGGLGDRGYRALADYLESVSLNSRQPIRPGATVSGIVYANREVPTIAAAVELVGENWSKRINLLVPVPGTESVQRRLEELGTIVRNQPTKTIADEAALRRALEALPCCAAAEDGTTDGPPLNLVVIGDPGDVISSFAHSLYRYRPVSPMRAFGREQDLSGKRISRWVAPKPLVIRGWIAPLRFRGEPVLVLQASTPRGGRFAPADALADDIDPRVDDARDAVIQEMLYSQSVSKLGFVRGASGTRGSFPTDGLRAVVLIDAMPVSLSHIDFFDWERPGDVSEHRSESGE